MNRIYRSIRNAATGAVVAVSEHVKSRGGPAAGASNMRVVDSLRSKPVLAMMALASASSVHAAPSGGTVVAGAASIDNSANNTTITQSSSSAILNWQSFDIGVGEAVRFVQPSSSAVALNRVLGADPSSILGSLSANGKVFLVNPNGILFGTGAQVNVGGLIASTRDIADRDFLAGKYHFTGTSSSSVLNQGSITADGGYVALLGAHVSNDGIIAARLGSVVLASGNALTLDVAGDGLLNVTVDAGAVDALATNGGLIQADGGHVLLTARSADALVQSAVNNTGVIQARTIEHRGGTIKLLGDMQSGAVNVAGTLDASAPSGGDGGFIETSAAHVQIASATDITTTAPAGATGEWLIDPVDFTIAASGGDITGAALSTNLSSSNVVIQSTSGGAGTAGDVNVNDVVTWNANRLTLNARNNININTTMNGSGSASLALEYGQGAVAASNTSTVNVRAPVNLSAGNNFSTKLGSDGAVVNYTVITSLGTAGSTTGTDLQGIDGALTSNFALGANIDASAASTWNSGAGFSPLGIANQYTGTFDGLGHVVSNLSINRSGTSNVGLFGVANSATFRNVGVINSSIRGQTYVGALVGNSFAGTYANTYSSGTVNGFSWVGGLVGLGNGTTMTTSYSTANVTGSSQLVGGLFGQARFFGTITDSYATGTVSASGATYVGGLTGQARFVTLTNTYATGNVTGGYGTGGLVGILDGATINSSYSTGAVSGSFGVGGLVGTLSGTTAVNTSYWNTTTSGQASSQGGTGLTTTQMQTAASFNTWDFGSKWILYEGHTNPLLRSFMTALTVTPSAIKSYDGLAYSGGSASYSTTPNGNLLGSLSYGGTAQGATNVGTYTLTTSGLYSNQQGYIISYAAGTLTVNPATLTAIASAPDKVYDGNNTATATLTLSGLIGTETLGVSNTATFNSQNVADANLVTIDSATLTNGSNGGLASNYTLASGQTTIAHITPKALTATITAPDKVYDGNTTANATLASLTGLLGSETVSGTVAASFNSQNVADANLVTVDGITLINGSNGGLASNYSVANGQTATAHITPKALSATITAPDKVYDGSDTATVSFQLDGLIGSEALGVSALATFNSKDVADANLVTASAVTLTDGSNGGRAGNYTLASGQTATAHITARALTVDGQTALDKVYDGTTAVTLAGGALVGVLTGESLTLNEAGHFATADVGDGIDVIASNSLGGAAAVNYTLTQPIGLAANITAVVTPEGPPTAVPPTDTPAPEVASAAGYQAAVAYATSNAPVAPASQASPLVLPAPVQVSSSASGGSYDLVGLNLTIVTRDESLPHSDEE